MVRAASSRVDLYAAIRRDAKSGLSKRALQRKHGVGYRTVAAALESAWPKQPKPPPKRGSRLDPYREVIDRWLRDDLDSPRKQRHTAKRRHSGQLSAQLETIRPPPERMSHKTVPSRDAWSSGRICKNHRAENQPLDTLAA